MAPGIWLGVVGMTAGTTALIAAILLLYTRLYSIHHDLAASLLAARLKYALGPAFTNYSLYFPPAEQAWFTVAVWLADWTGLRLDLAPIALAALALLVSTGLAYHIRRRTMGASPLFLLGSIAVLAIVPVLYKNLFGLREHLVVLGLWPYLVLRVSDPEGRTIGWRMRLFIGLWLGATLTLKYLYSLVVLLVELTDAALRRKPGTLFRIENLAAGLIVAAYLFGWLVLHPEQREVIGAVVSAIDANLLSTAANAQRTLVWLVLALPFVGVAVLKRLPLPENAIAAAAIVGTVLAAYIQARWYSHHAFPVTMALFAWLWILHRHIEPVWLVALGLLAAWPIVPEFSSTAQYQQAVRELDAAMAKEGQIIAGKRVGLLAMHPSPFNQYIAMKGAVRWTASNNNAYVASALQDLDRPGNAGRYAPPVTLDDPGRALLHDEMLRLLEDRPPEVLILDHSTNWPLRYLQVDWRRVFADDPRFQKVLERYRPVSEYEGRAVKFSYYERRTNTATPTAQR